MEFGDNGSKLDYEQMIFRGIDRIQIIAQSDFKDHKSKLYAFTWSVKLFEALVTDNIKDDIFRKEASIIKDKISELRKKDKHDYKLEDDFDVKMELVEACINLFGRRGFLYKNVRSGRQR